jgi:cobalt-zinc-cadmium efflux system membrane fusion protein
MNRREFAMLALSLGLSVCGTGCNGDKSNPQAEAPPPLKVERVEDRNLFQVDRPERFHSVQAVEHIASPQLKVTGTVNPDISRAVPVISLAAGRVVEIDARLGDTVKKGQLFAQSAKRGYFGRLLGLSKCSSRREIGQHSIRTRETTL